MNVVDRAAGTATAPAGQALHQNIGIHIHQQRQLQRLAEPRQHGVERLGLGDIARKTVEYETVFSVRFGKPGLDHAEHDLVGNQLSGIHGGLGPFPQLAAGGYLGSQQVARGHLWNFVLLDQ